MNTFAAILLTITISIETPEQIQAGWKDWGYDTPVVAWAEWDKGTSPIEGCIIHVPPLTQDTLGTWIHEIGHCRRGYWHD